MSRLSTGPSPRAWAIAEGLVRTRRAIEYDVSGPFIRVDGFGSARYWISDDGGRVLRGSRLATADRLQPGFVEMMARTGAAGR